MKNNKKINKQKLFLSIVIPVKNEEKNIKILYKEICSSLKNYNFEIIYVDDGSTDKSFTELTKLYNNDKRVKVIRFRVNYGKASAYTAGFLEAEGDLVATMDGDFQDDPKDLIKLIKKIEEENYDLVVGRKITGKSSFSTFILSKIFNFFIRVISGAKVHDLNCPMRVMRYEVASKLNIYSGLFRYIPIIAKEKGYKITEQSIGNRKRLYGKSKFTGKKYFKSLFDFVTTYFLAKYSERPLHVFGSLGVISFFIGFFVDLYILIGFIFYNFSIRNNLGTLLFGVLLIILGVQLISTGLLGEMINYNKSSEQNSSRYIIKEKLVKKKITKK